MRNLKWSSAINSMGDIAKWGMSWKDLNQKTHGSQLRNGLKLFAKNQSDPNRGFGARFGCCFEVGFAGGTKRKPDICRGDLKSRNTNGGNKGHTKKEAVVFSPNHPPPPPHTKKNKLRRRTLLEPCPDHPGKKSFRLLGKNNYTSRDPKHRTTATNHDAAS